MWELTRYGLQEKNRTIDSFILFYVNWKWKGLATIFGHSRSITAALRGGKLETAALPPLPSAVKSIFQFSSAPRGGKLEITALPPLSSAVNRIFQFSSSPRGGKLEIAALPPLPSAVKSIFQFSSALRGGKLEIAFTLLVHVAESFQSDSLSFFPFLCSSVGHGSGLSSTK